MAALTIVVSNARISSVAAAIILYMASAELHRLISAAVS